MELVAAAPRVGFVASRISIRTGHAREFIDLTDAVLEQIRRSGISQGIAVVTSQHTTAAIAINEHEPELLKDLDELLARMAPQENVYAHNEVPCEAGEQPNGHAHCQALLLSASATVPIVGGQAALGRYQRIFLVELDCARDREVTVVLLGA